MNTNLIWPLPPRWLSPALALAASLATTAALYGSSLQFGFLLDDAMDLPRASGNSYSQILTSAGDSAYYRPVVLLVWKTLYELLGRHDPLILHGLCLGAHSLNGLLVYLLVSRLAGRATGGAALLLFAVFPFGYQAVSHINSFFHLVVTGCVLGALLVYSYGRSHSSPMWLALALALGAAGCLTHEYGVVVVAVIVLFEGREYLLGRAVRIAWPVAFLVLAAAYGFVWWTMPRWQTNWALDLANIRVNAAYLAQGMLFPLVALLPEIAKLLPLGSEGIMATVSVLALALGLFLVRLNRAQTLLLTAVGWYYVAILPAMLLLPYHTYLVDAPRLMYFAAVPAALVWALAVSALLGLPARWMMASTAVFLLAVIGLTWPAASFVNDKSALMSSSTQVSGDLAKALAAHPDERLLVVNFPAWVAPAHTEHLLGHTGFSILPDYIGMERLGYVLTGRKQTVISVSFPPLAPKMPYNLGMHGKPRPIEELAPEAQQSRAVYLADYSDQGLRLRWVGGQTPAEAMGAPLTTFGGWARLEAARTVRERDTLTLDLLWSPLDTPTADYTLFAHLYGPDGRPVAQADGYPMAGMVPPRLWRSGLPFLDRRILLLPGEIEPGEYVLATGWYDRANGRRAEAVDANGERWSDDVAVIGRITIP